MPPFGGLAVVAVSFGFRLRGLLVVVLPGAIGGGWGEGEDGIGDGEERVSGGGDREDVSDETAGDNIWKGPRYAQCV